MIRSRLIALPALVAVLALAGAAGSARAAAEVHKVNVVINVIPTSVDGGDFNRQIDDFNATQLAQTGLQTLDHVSFGWQFGGELRYFLRPNIALSAGVSQLRAVRQREYLPTLTSDVVVTGEIISAPIHLGADYYFTAYNQGDFRAQFFAGGGILGLTSTHSRLEVDAVGTDTTMSWRNYRSVTAGDGTGYYGELGVHMFFAVRYSVMLGAVYRSAEVRPVAVYSSVPGQPEVYVGSTSRSVSASGIGVRASLAIGL